jgi:serine/threonine protein phosphatase 1
MTGRFIAIGDIHGCHEEFAELLARLAPTADDRLVLLGDMVNRGPDSARVLDLARQYRALAILGNHELRLLRHHRDGQRLKPAEEATAARLRPEHWDWLARLPLTHAEPARGLLCVHGGFLPGQPWTEQPAEIVTRIQFIDTQGRAQKRSDCPDGRPWAETWQGPATVLYGHTPRPDIVRYPQAIGLDTACVFGGHLTAYVWPDQRCVQVKARQAYYAS